MGVKLSATDSFIMKAKSVHGDRYDYSKVNYILSRLKVIITCGEHGVFMQTPNNHLNGKGCLACSGNKKMTIESFVEKAKNTHGDTYSYSRVKYTGNKSKVLITCREHGDFKQTPSSHLCGGGCPSCSEENRSLNLKSNTFEFIKTATLIHDGRYSYDKTEYVNSLTHVVINCGVHGSFSKTPGHHLSGQGCPSCVGKARNDTHGFIKKAKVEHGSKYSYDNLKYVNNKAKVLITCHEHGDFAQTPTHHLEIYQ